MSTQSASPLVPSAPAPSSSSVTPPTREGRGRTTVASWALALSLVALLGAAAVMAFVGLTVVPIETASGYYLTDTPGWYQAAVLAAFGSLLLWTLAGLAAIVLGILALLRRSGIARSVVAIVLAVLAPSLTTAVLLGTMALDISQL